MNGRQLRVPESGEVLHERLLRTTRTLDTIVARERSLELVCPECDFRCDASEIPEDRDPWCFDCGTRMEQAC
jgi:hypothetical protein